MERVNIRIKFLTYFKYTEEEVWQEKKFALCLMAGFSSRSRLLVICADQSIKMKLLIQ